MVATELTPELIREGSTLIEQLDKVGASPGAALWLYFPDASAWRLMLTEERLGAEGPRKAYRTVQKVLQALGDEIKHLSLNNITLTTPDAPIVTLLRRALGAESRISGIRFTGNAIDGTLIEDAFIYRLRAHAS